MQNYIKKGKQENKQMELFKFKLINKINLNDLLNILLSKKKCSELLISQIIKRVTARNARLSVKADIIIKD